MYDNWSRSVRCLSYHSRPLNLPGLSRTYCNDARNISRLLGAYHHSERSTPSERENKTNKAAMVLAIEELEAAENLNDGRNKISGLLKLRDSTRIYIIQCLADREIQKEIGKETTSGAYRYNCAVIHSPHKWFQVYARKSLQRLSSLLAMFFFQYTAVSGHGWDSARSQPCDPKLRIGRVMYGNNNSDNRTMPEEKDEVRQLTETINILREENITIKRLYLSLMNSNKGSLPSSPDPASRAIQHRLEQEIGILRAQLEAKTQKIRQMDGERVRLTEEVGRLTSALQNERNNNHRRQPSVRRPTVTFDDTTRIFIPIESTPRNKSCCTIL